MTKSHDQSKKKPLHQLVAELDKQYLATRKEWKKPSATFAGHEDRFAMAVPVAPAPYNPTNGTISDSVARAKKVRSPWAEDVSPQRPRVPSPVCNGDYSPHSQSSLNQSARSAFASQTPKLLEPQSTTPPPGAYNAASPSPSKSRPSAAMASKSPRFSDPVVWTKTSYNPEVGTVNYEVQKAKKVPSPWSKTREPQRPAAAKVVDASYDVKLPGSTPTTARAAFKSAAQRFVEEKPQAPPVGTYTSPLISCGMLS